MYRVPERTEEVVKHHRRVHSPWTHRVDESGLVPEGEVRFPVLILPGFPLSGTPVYQVEHRDDDYGWRSRVPKCIVTAMLVVAFSVSFSAVQTKGEEKVTDARATLSFVFVFLLFGFLIAALFRNSWKNTILHEGEIHVNSTRYETTSENNIVIYTTARMEASSIPLVAAVPSDVTVQDRQRLVNVIDKVETDKFGYAID